MTLMRPFAAAALMAAVATPAMAEEVDQQKIYINPFMGFQLFDDKRDLSETATFGAGLEYRFLPSWALEAVWSQGHADRKYVPGESDFDDYRLDGLYYFGEIQDTWNPYLATGAGHTEFEALGGGINGETRLNVGGGVRYNISDNLSLRGDIREFYSLDEEAYDTLATVGISIGFGMAGAKSEPQDSDNDGVMDDTDQCPNTAPGAQVDATGCEIEADADNDGVVDSQDQCPNTPAGAEVNSTGCELDSDNDGVVNSKDQCPGTEAGAKVDEKGCTGVTEAIETFTLEVQFPLNSAVIGDQYDSELQRVADFMEEHPETVVEIAGHSDSSGKAEYNQALSQRRAEAVAKRLTNRLGVEQSRVSATGYGESEPVADNSTAAGRADNRRVEARIQIER
ncbi:MAG: hypothetical protein CL581_07280 [Alteromonadaceae bacterium]|nr:hypothetical protein [Alteromonadaceae bacterium]MBH84781.1 hypothetical protein [Alteromonadaceae bacterium]|tara:strand:+ start:58533 stop:59720 length:1188 start_codon:yes stop_codon:yes gene_type:complete